MAGAAGALYAHYIRIVDPDVFLFIYTVTMVIMVITGGKGTLAGPIVGGLIFGLLPETLRALAIRPEVQWIVYGVLHDPRPLLPACGDRAGRPAAVAAAPNRRRRRSGHMTSQGAFLSVEGLSIHFGGLVAVDSVTFEVREGEVLSPDRPERRGQDHGVQRDHRLSRADRGRDPVPRRAPERPEAQPGRRARPRAHLPEDERVRRAERPGEHPHRTALALEAAAARDHARPALGRARGARPRGRGAQDPGVRGLERARAGARRTPCPTASSACSRSRWRSPRGRSCSCSTSRCRA